MKVAMIIVRTLLGLLFLMSSVVYLLIVMGVIPMPDIPAGPLKTFNEGLAASGYFMTLLKVTEFVCAILLLTGRFVPLALILLSPIIVNIFFVHLFLDRNPASMGVAIFAIAANIFLAYCYRDAFKPLLTSKYETLS
jgi:putative oxidoreductase